MALKLAINNKSFRTIGFVTIAILAFGGYSFANQKYQLRSTQKQEMSKLPEITNEEMMGDQIEQSKVEIKHESSQQSSPGTSATSNSSSFVEHRDGTNNISVTNQSSQTAISGSSDSANANNTTSTNINIQN